MPTFKDIAKAAGVSYGTVSNVLNGRGNVRSDKVRLVEEAAVRLGYVINKGAQQLRKGISDVIAVILPDLYAQPYIDFFMTFKHYAEGHGYTPELYLTGNSPAREQEQMELIRSKAPMGIAGFFCGEGSNPAGFFPEGRVVSVEQMNLPGSCYVGFDYHQAGIGLAQGVPPEARHVTILAENERFDAQKELIRGIRGELARRSCTVDLLVTDALRCRGDVLRLLDDTAVPDAILITSFAFTHTVKNIHDVFFAHLPVYIGTISPVFTLPEKGCINYELNYRLMGRAAAKRLINNIDMEHGDLSPILLENDGLNQWHASSQARRVTHPLTIVTLDSPTAQVLKGISHLYTESTGTEVQVCIYPYDGIHELLTHIESVDNVDIIRLDCTWMSWFAKRIFVPLTEIDSHVMDVFRNFIPNLQRTYSLVDGVPYSLPETPSAQLLFYRKDLFENAALRRQFAETYRRELTPPATFEAFNQTAAFFTRACNPASPTAFGANLTLGNSGTAATEFLTRYFSYTHALYDQEGRALLTSEAARSALRDLIAVKPYANPACNSWWRSTARDFAEGQVAMTTLFSNYASEMVFTQSNVIGKIGYAMVPGGNPLLGGGAIGVCRYARDKEEAYRFIRWMLSDKTATAMASMGSVSPCAKTYENYDVLDTYPWLSLMRRCFECSDTQRIPDGRRTPFNERRFLSIIGTAVSNACMGAMTADKALEWARRSYEVEFL